MILILDLTPDRIAYWSERNVQWSTSLSDTLTGTPPADLVPAPAGRGGGGRGVRVTGPGHVGRPRPAERSRTMSGRDIGYIVIEWNQASKQPTACAEVYEGPGMAQDRADWFTSQAAAHGRRERYSIHPVGPEEDA